MRPAQLLRLRELIGRDPEADALALAIREEALPLIGQPATPLLVIHYEGMVHTDPRRVATVRNLRQMGDLARLVRHWQASADPAAEDTIQEWITGWAATYRPTGNDVNENKLYPLLVGYYSLRSADFPASARATIEAWVAQLGELHAQSVRNSRNCTNRYTKQLRLVAVCGLILDRADWRELVLEGCQTFVANGLFPDGSSVDLRTRDSLTYHASALQPVLELAMLSGRQGHDLYRWQSQEGASLKNSVDYVVPFANGQKQRREWTHSQVALDHARAEAGLKSYEPGRLFDPREALELIEQASFFDPSLVPLVLQLHGTGARRLASWPMLVHAVAHDRE